MKWPSRLTGWRFWLFFASQALVFGWLAWDFGGSLVSETGLPQWLRWIVTAAAATIAPILVIRDEEQGGPDRRKAKFFRGAPPWAEPLWDRYLRPFGFGLWVGTLTWVVALVLLFATVFAPWDFSLRFPALETLPFVFGIALGLVGAVIAVTRGLKPFGMGLGLASALLNALFLSTWAG